MKLLKNILFILFFLSFCGELIQNNHIWIKSPPLRGGIVSTQQPCFNLDNWFSGKYQDSLMTYFEQNLDLHVPLIRLHNQIAYSAFGEINVAQVESGRDQILFESGYIQSYMGQAFVGENTVKETVNKLVFVQTELKKRNIDLLFVIAPTKPFYMPENIPSKYDLSKKGMTNYDAYLEQFEKQKINYIDMANYFLKLKSTSKYPLFTRCGIHWSSYGATIAGDSLIKYMENQRNIDLTDYYYDGGELTNKPRDADNDIGEAMNMITNIPSYDMYYPNLVIKKDFKKVKPDVLLIGDSFAWSWILFYKFIPELFSENSAYWFYNRELAWTKKPFELKFPLDEKTLAEQTLHRDFILIVNNQWNLNRCGNGFIEQMYDLLKKENSTK